MYCQTPGCPGNTSYMEWHSENNARSKTGGRVARPQGQKKGGYLTLVRGEDGEYTCSICGGHTARGPWVNGTPPTKGAAPSELAKLKAQVTNLIREQERMRAEAAAAAKALGERAARDAEEAARKAAAEPNTGA